MRYKAILTIGCALFSSTPAISAWRTDTSTDRLTDKTVKTAVVSAKSDDKGTTADLMVYCLGFKGDTAAVVSIRTNSTFYPGKMGLRFRVDNREPEPRYMPTDSDGRGMSLWMQPRDLFGAKRLRVELEPYRKRNLFFEFDIAGAEKTVRSLGCKRLGSFE